LIKAGLRNPDVRRLAGIGKKQALAAVILECLFDMLDGLYNCPGTLFRTGIPVNVDSHPEKNKEKGNREYGCQHYFPVHRASLFPCHPSRHSLSGGIAVMAPVLDTNNLTSEEI
jgi:hypothetical protein